MISISEAQAVVERHAPAPERTEVPLAEAGGLRLASAVTAPEPMPAFDNSSMDGYAVALRDPASDNAQELRVVGESQAGDPFEETVQPGQAVKISTGAVVPAGADRVVPIEDTDGGDPRVHLNDIGAPHANVRFRGEEVAVGDAIAEAGERLTPPLLGRLASLGVAQVPVFAPPVVALLTTGSELVDVDADLGPGQIRDANRYVLTAVLNETGARLGPVESVPDRWDDTADAIDRAADRADVVLVTGGVSVGPHDHVKSAAEEVGFERRFWKVRQKPGKPLYSATRDETLLLGLPGNPFSATISTMVYVCPLLRRGQGNSHPEGRRMPGRLAASYDRLAPERAQFVLVRVDGVEEGTAVVRGVDKQGSHMLAGLHESDGYIHVPADRERVEAGERFDVTLFPWHEAGRVAERAGEVQPDAV
ncbi:MAG: gephyrin-like molybdotransferase Glp [Salinibacter sp.]